MLPNPSASPSPGSSARGILLVEPYDALRIALSSALRKFAPHHAIRVTQCLSDAEEAMETIRPELFVLDLDPAQGGEILFFNRLSQEHPETRVLVIAAGTSQPLQNARGRSAAIRFIEKPFDLAEFGAAVQALLGPWTAPPSQETRATVRDLHVLDVAQLKCLALSSAVLHFASIGGGSGEIHFSRGEIIHARAGRKTGIAALEEMMHWEGGEWNEETLPTDGPKTIDQPWNILLLELSRTESARAAEKEPALPAKPAPPLAPGKTILVVDDTEMLLVFASDVLTTADRSFAVLTAGSGAEGLRLARERRPDLLLLDYSLSDINGDEVCRQLLEEPATAHIPVLMMSGHLPELQTAAASYRNIVGTLPKPFLSGTLINEVERVFDENLKPAPETESPTEPAPAPAPEENHAPQPDLAASANGHGSSTHGGFAIESPNEPPNSPGASLLVAPAESGATRWPHGQMKTPPPTAIAAEERDLSLTLSCEVTSVQLAPDFRMGAMQLRPAEETVTVKMESSSNGGGLPGEKDFRLGPAQLNPEGGLSTLRIFPATQHVHALPNGRDFAVAEVSASPGEEGRLLRLTGTENAAMRVRLMLKCQLRTIELDDDFGVAAVVLQLRGNEASVQSGDTSALAMQMFIHRVELTEDCRLTNLLVSSLP